MDNIGIKALGDKRKLFMLTSAAFSALSIILFIVAMAGWTEDTSSITSSDWGYYEDKGIGAKYYMGLRILYVNQNGNGASSQTTTKYSDCASQTDSCKTCESAGKAALGLLLLSFIFTVTITVLSVLRSGADKSVYKLVAVILGVLLWLFSISSFGNFNEKCIKKINKEFDFQFKPAAGYNCNVAGWFFMWIILIIHILTPVSSTSVNLGDEPVEGEPAPVAANAKVSY
jgi:hypothetical protein